METKRIILIISCELLNRKLLSKLLESEYIVLQAESREEAWEILQKYYWKKRISAVLLDIFSSEANPYEIAEQMREDPFFSKIPIIATIREANDMVGLEALQHGIDDYILPPYYSKVLSLRLNNLIQAAEAKTVLNILETDALTGLFTKDAFYRKVEERLRAGETGYCIVAADIERFKVFNDTYGEAEGDNLLRCVAGEFQRVLEKETLLARGYADQFFFFTKKQKDLEEKILKISEQIENNFPFTKVIVKFGIYEIREEDGIVRAMCDRAALAIGMIKNQYDKVFCYYNDTIRENLVIEQKITSIMNQALEMRQFQVYYQPKFDTEVESVVGAEALVRWVHPEYGFLSPGEFRPVFEKNGFITEVEKYVWEEVCSFL